MVAKLADRPKHMRYSDIDSSMMRANHAVIDPIFIQHITTMRHQASTPHRPRDCSSAKHSIKCHRLRMDPIALLKKTPAPAIHAFAQHGPASHVTNRDRCSVSAGA
jgi:hypothetical protein